ncbi:MAG: selenocysteine-specific translation elongation factor [Alphaproteobacteria bacterium]|nr:selenocysteine-specific translation elongation factor [Alphaproteobacteria bacterium]
MIVATAGHIDHGKTLLVKALTGIDADRLPEEKQRGMTIDLGFAYHTLTDGTVLGFVDVPGHERFIGNMLAGVTGIDYALLVVAADDGPMPQTREHLAILNLLGVSRGIVALTKIDRVEATRVADVSAAITNLLAPTTLADAPIFPVSAITGDGVEALAAHFSAVAGEASDRSTRGNFRLAIDRAFTVAGAGLVVTGTVFTGRIEAGTHMFLADSGESARVRGIHANNQESGQGVTGQRCAVNLAGIDKEIVRRGDWLVSSPDLRPVRKMDTQLRVLDTEVRPLRHWTPVHVHLGAADVTGRVAVLGADQIAPGAIARAQLVLDQPIGAVARDRFIIRDQSAQRTLGGGHVVDIFPPARGRARPERLAMLDALDTDDDAAALTDALNVASTGLDLRRFAIARNLTGDELEAVVGPSAAIVIGPAQSRLAFSQAAWQSLREDTLAALDRFHAQHTDRLGPSVAQLRRSLGRHVAEEAFAGLVDALTADGTIASDGMLLHRPSQKPVLAPEDQKLWIEISPLLSETPHQPPVVHDLAREVGVSPEKIARTLRRAAALGLVIQASKNRFFESAALASLATVFEDVARDETDGVGPGAFRDRAGMGRNLAIEVLEFFDRAGLSQREGNVRRLVRPAREVFPTADG